MFPNRFTRLLKVCITFCFGALLTFFSMASTPEQITSLYSPDKMPKSQSPVLEIAVEINKTRDLHVVLQHNSKNGWQTVKSKFKRLKKSGAYRFKMDISDIEPGAYRWSTYLTPRKKNWNQRLANPTFANIEILPEAESTASTGRTKKAKSKQDRVTKVDWPSQINDDASYQLSINYQVSEPRELHIKLFDKKNWQEGGSVTLPINESGDVQLPFEQLLSNFGRGDFAWVIYLSDLQGEPLNNKKFGKHFKLGSAK